MNNDYGDIWFIFHKFTDLETYTIIDFQKIKTKKKMV